MKRWQQEVRSAPSRIDLFHFYMEPVLQKWCKNFFSGWVTSGEFSVVFTMESMLCFLTWLKQFTSVTQVLGSRRWETSIILLQIAEVSRVFLPEPFELTFRKIWVPYLDCDFLQGRWHALVKCRQNKTRTSLPCIQCSPKLPSSPSTDIASANTALANLWALVGLLAFPLDMDGNPGAGSFCVSKNRRQGTIAIAHRGIWFVL